MPRHAERACCFTDPPRKVTIMTCAYGSRPCLVISLAAAIAIANMGLANGESPILFKYQRQKLTDVYFSEGANAGDLNRDGKPDIVYGPYWFESPDFRTKHEIYPPKPQNKEG